MKLSVQVPLDTSFQNMILSHSAVDDRKMYSISAELEPKGVSRDQIV